MSSPLSADPSDLSVDAYIPCEQLAFRSVQVGANQLNEDTKTVTTRGKTFTNWTPQNHDKSFILLQQIAHLWETTHFTNQFLIYGKVSANKIFNWEIVPHQSCKTIFGRWFQQIQILWRTIFGGIPTTPETRDEQNKWYSKLAETASHIIPSTLSITRNDALGIKSNDPFCRNEVIERQRVLEGRTVNVLFSDSPIGFGGERLHFLIIPKQHREDFTELTQEEYIETMDFTKNLVEKYGDKEAHLMFKKGPDAGTTVKHSHLHLIFSSNRIQDIWGKLTVLKNIFCGSSKLPPDKLVARVTELRTHLQGLNKTKTE